MKMGRVHHTHVGGISEGEQVMMGMLTVANHPAVILFDFGASHTFINRDFVVKYEIPIRAVDNSFCIQSSGGRIITHEVVY